MRYSTGQLNKYNEFGITFSHQSTIRTFLELNQYTFRNFPNTQQYEPRIYHAVFIKNCNPEISFVLVTNCTIPLYLKVIKNIEIFLKVKKKH